MSLFDAPRQVPQWWIEKVPIYAKEKRVECIRATSEHRVPLEKYEGINCLRKGRKNRKHKKSRIRAVEKAGISGWFRFPRKEKEKECLPSIITISTPYSTNSATSNNFIKVTSQPAHPSGTPILPAPRSPAVASAPSSSTVPLSESNFAISHTFHQL